MSKHGIVPPQDPQGRRPNVWSSRLFIATVARQLFVGGLFWALRTTHSAFDLPIAAALLLGLLVGTRWFGMLRPRSWPVASKEAALLFLGAAGFANILVLTFGVAPWFAAGVPN